MPPSAFNTISSSEASSNPLPESNAFKLFEKKKYL
jgi:hypothetical protein